MTKVNQMKLVCLRRVRINSGGYDDCGSYWGVGQSLYYYEFDDGDSGHMRAPTRADAKARVLEARYASDHGERNPSN